MDGRVAQLIAALNNPQVRRRFAAVVVSDEPVERADDDRMLIQAGVLRLDDERVTISQEGLAELLRSAREAIPERAPGRLDTLPRRARQRAETLEGLAAAVFADAESVLSERELGTRLAKHVTDVALFRRAMVDDGIVVRDAAGRAYRRVGGV
jgi:hypothetical protein